jgi:hypothetical protein
VPAPRGRGERPSSAGVDEDPRGYRWRSPIRSAANGIVHPHDAGAHPLPRSSLAAWRRGRSPCRRRRQTVSGTRRIEKGARTSEKCPPSLVRRPRTIRRGRFAIRKGMSSFDTGTLPVVRRLFPGLRRPRPTENRRRTNENGPSPIVDGRLPVERAPFPVVIGRPTIGRRRRTTGEGRFPGRRRPFTNEKCGRTNGKGPRPARNRPLTNQDGRRAILGGDFTNRRERAPFFPRQSTTFGEKFPAHKKPGENDHDHRQQVHPSRDHLLQPSEENSGPRPRGASRGQDRCVAQTADSVCAFTLVTGKNPILPVARTPLRGCSQLDRADLGRTSQADASATLGRHVEAALSASSSLRIPVRLPTMAAHTSYVPHAPETP